jgi:hypothetical protein
MLQTMYAHLSGILITCKRSMKMVNEWEILCSPSSSIRLDVAKMMNHCTLDIICTAALGFPVDSVQNPDHPLARTHLDIL